MQVIERKGQRVLTTNQLAIGYGADPKIINRNFQRNVERFVEGKHYFTLTGEELRKFKGSRQIDPTLKYTSVLYLWTEKGAFLHAKSLNTDKAWDVYDKLVDSYFVKAKVLSEKDQLIASLKLTLENSEELGEIKEKVHTLEKRLNNELTLNHGQATTLNHEIKKRIEQLFSHGIRGSLETKRQMYSKIYSQLRRAFQAPTYREVKRTDYTDAIRWIEAWRPM